jgi:dipeptidyl aminopeptidase/acylaminoacyl peptidase
MKIAHWGFLISVAFSLALPVWGQGKPKLTLDEFFNSVHIPSVKISPAGDALVVSTVRGDWVQERFRNDLWLIRDNASPVLLTSSGEDSDPKWSPDGRWVAFLSERQIPWTKSTPSDDEENPKSITHLYVISASGGEAIPVTRGEESVHAFAWGRDAKSLFFSTREPWSKAKRDAYKKEWKDVVRYREADRGDVIARIAVADAITRAEAMTPNTAALEEQEKPSKDSPATKKDENKEQETAETPGTVILARVPLLADEIAVANSGQKLAFVTHAPHRRNERVEDQEIFVIDAAGQKPRQLTNNQALESDLLWSKDDQQILFSNRTDGIDSKYQQTQGRIYTVDAQTGKAQRWAPDFPGHISDFELTSVGNIVALGQLGMETQLYSGAVAAARLAKAQGWPGTYQNFSTSEKSPKVAFIYSAWDKPA